MKEQDDSNRRKRTQRDYSLAFKLEIITEVERGELTYKQAQRRYGIQGRSTVLVWLRKHGTLDWKGNNPMKGKPKPGEKIKDLERKLKRLEAEKIILNRAIDIADEQLGTDIRKKYLALLSEASKRRQQSLSEPGAALNEDEEAGHTTDTASH
jgi:transposase-like protein